VTAMETSEDGRSMQTRRNRVDGVDRAAAAAIQVNYTILTYRLKLGQIASDLLVKLC
jgi:hypothetical protein